MLGRDGTDSGLRVQNFRTAKSLQGPFESRLVTAHS